MPLQGKIVLGLEATERTPERADEHLAVNLYGQYVAFLTWSPPMIRDCANRQVCYLAFCRKREHILNRLATPCYGRCSIARQDYEEVVDELSERVVGRKGGFKCEVLVGCVNCDGQPAVPCGLKVNLKVVHSLICTSRTPCS